MSKITNAKLNRAIFRESTKRKRDGYDVKGNPKYKKQYRIAAYQPAADRQPMQVRYNGRVMTAYVAQGQVINPRREFERQFGAVHAEGNPKAIFS